MEKPLKKHYTKLYLGFCKQYKRQANKPSEIIIDLPIKIVLPKNFKGVYTHSIEVYNSIWNGINLVQLTNREAPETKIGGMYSKFTINKEGKYILSRYGKQILEKRKQKNVDNFNKNNQK